MNNNIQHIKATEEQFFKLWIEMLQPFLKLRRQEIDLLAKLLYHRHQISGRVSNMTEVERLLLSEDNRRIMRKELKCEDYTFNNLLVILRKKKLVIGKSINPAIVPNVENNFQNFNFTYSIAIKPKE
jgi:hypothetical protein